MKNQLKVVKVLQLLVLLIVQMCFSVGADNSLPEISVSASRTPISSTLSGSSITLIEADDIHHQQADFVSDVLVTTPGLGLSHNGGVGKLTQLRIRGAEANHTLVLLDGIEANDIAIGSEFDFAYLSTCGVERVEVLRGPQSALWGSDALSGLVSVASKRGNGPLKLDGYFRGGSYRTWENCTGISAGNDNHGLSIYTHYYDTDGINTSHTGSERDGFDKKSVNIRYDFLADNGLSINLIVKHNDISTDTDDFEYAQDYSQHLVDADRRNEVIQNYGKLVLQYDSPSDGFMQKLSLGVTDTKNDIIENDFRIERFVGEKLKLSYQATVRHHTEHTQHTVTFAHEREREKFKQRAAISIFGDPNQNQKVTSKSNVLEYRLGMFKRLFLGASLRKDHNNDFDDSNTHRVSAVYTPNNFTTKLHAAHGTGIKNPGFTERFGYSPNKFIGNPELKPEKSKSYELGISQRINNQLNVSATYFKEKLDDEINGFASTDTLGVYTAENLDDKSKRKGIELSFDAELTESINLAGNYSHIDAKQPGSAGNREVRRPKNTANLLLDIEAIPDKAHISFRVNYIGEQIDTDFGVSPSRRRTLDDYILLNLAASYRLNQSVELQAKVENLLDEDYVDVIGYNTPGIRGFIGINFNQ